MIGVVDVGGGLRGVYGAGVFDTCLDEGIAFDYLIGVSAGSANVASFLAGQKGRNLKFYADYSFRKAYMSFRNLLRRGELPGPGLHLRGRPHQRRRGVPPGLPGHGRPAGDGQNRGHGRGHRPAGVLRLSRHGPGRLRGHQGQLLRAGGQPPLPVAGEGLLRRGGSATPSPSSRPSRRGVTGWWSSSPGPRTTTGTPKRTSGWPNFCGSIPTPPGFWPCGRRLTTANWSRPTPWPRRARSSCGPR